MLETEKRKSVEAPVQLPAQRPDRYSEKPEADAGCERVRTQ